MHQVFHASSVYFKADSAHPTTRRALSVGPGTVLPLDDDPTLDWDFEDVNAANLTHLPTDQVSSGAGGVALTHSNSVTSQANVLDQVQGPPMARGQRNFPPRSTRRVSVDSHFFQREPISHEVRDDIPIPPYSPIDPASPTALSPSNSLHGTVGSSNGHTHAAQSLEEYRAELQTNMHSYQTSKYHYT